MRKIHWGLIVVPILAIIVIFCFSQIYLSAPHAGPDVARSKRTVKELFVATIAPEGNKEPTVGPMTSWMLTVRFPNGRPVRDATIQVDGGMPDHDHGLPTQPQVTADLGEGHYRIDGLKFTMPGLWQLKLEITAEDEKDEAVFNVLL